MASHASVWSYGYDPDPTLGSLDEAHANDVQLVEGHRNDLSTPHIGSPLITFFV